MVFIVGYLFFSRGREPKKNALGPSEKEIEIQIEDQSEKTNKEKKDSITIYEDRIGNIPLPFPKREMLDELKQSFKTFTIVKEMGQQDGPDFPLYALKRGDKELGYFSMDYEDSLKLNEVYIQDAMAKDEYGLRVGDGYQKIKKLRGGEIKTYTNYHQHTFAYIENSHIFYEIFGDALIDDTIDVEEIEFTEAQLKDWKIEYIIWRE